MKWNDLDTQPCSIARSLSVVGDRWTMLILRSAFLRTRRFDEFQQQIGLTSHLLANRLNKLVKMGVMEKKPYQQRPVRYEYRLTEQGRDLYPVLQSLVAWGDKWLDGGKGAPVEYVHQRCGHKYRPMMVCSECKEPLDPREVTPRVGPGLRGLKTAAARRA